MDINQKQEVEVRRETSCGGSVEHLRGLRLEVLQSDGKGSGEAVGLLHIK